MADDVKVAFELWFQHKSDVTRAGLVSVISNSRLLVPLVENKNSGGPEMVQISFHSHDGRKALLAFTCIEQLQAFNPQARPFVKDSMSVALEALEQNYDGIIIDFASEHRLALTLSEIASIARD